ncbi:ribonuclease YeeF family protein [Sporosarcina sp. Te-1]|uniref:ribonuclease YeeF family protein n=1 Tax=Sporosarcina sp. Te-1 TaxID=2818390 RepID=UPI001A9DBDAC|nr:T7SS effector LXG polymorphic toxin [Sporosarcina sp. Te-1]QTD39543.1 hypothetical protein J3U78_11765 [Sporosarcina sp. Te-1]
MKILSVSPFQEGLQRNITMLDRLSTEMETIDRAVRDLVEMEEQLKGMGGSAIRSFYRECHLPFLLFFRMFSNRFKQVLHQMEAALHSLEPDPSGYIDEQFLEGELEQGLTLIGRLTASLTDEANSIMDKVSDIVALPHLDDSEVQEGVIHSKRKRDDTIVQLYEFDVAQTFALNAIEHDLLAMDNWLATIEGLFQSGVQDINFQPSQWNVLTFGSEIRTELLPKVFLDPWGNEHEKLLGTMLTAATFKTLEGKKVNTIDQNVDENVKYHVYNNGLLIKEYMVGSSVFYEVVPHVEYKEEEIITATVAEENNWVDDLQFGLDLVGLIPVIGEPADGLNAIIYAARGDTVNAALSVGGMIPVAGWFSTGGKLVYKSTTNVKQVKNVVSTDAMKSIYTPVYQDVINNPLSRTQFHLGKMDDLPMDIGKVQPQYELLMANGYHYSTPSNFTFNKPYVVKDISAPSTSGVSDVKVDTKKNVNVETNGIDKTRPSWRQSEIDVEKDLPEYNAQKSFKDGKEVPYGEKGSSRPDLYQTGHSIEVKNYKITTSSGRSRLVNNVSRQVEKRISDLPNGTKQSVIIDIRGQNVSDEILDELYEKIMNKTNGKVEIRFKTN